MIQPPKEEVIPLWDKVQAQQYLWNKRVKSQEDASKTASIPSERNSLTHEDIIKALKNDEEGSLKIDSDNGTNDESIDQQVKDTDVNATNVFFRGDKHIKENNLNG